MMKTHGNEGRGDRKKTRKKHPCVIIIYTVELMFLAEGAIFRGI